VGYRIYHSLRWVVFQATGYTTAYEVGGLLTLVTDKLKSR